jgi:uncharacterized repeat protein (TIGR04076 family)
VSGGSAAGGDRGDRDGGARPRRRFRLFDLRVEIVAVKPGLESVCNHHLGDYFEVSGENLSIPAGRTFSMYALAAVLPLLPAKQRATDEHDWMGTEDLVMCPDPHCEAVMRIIRTGVREFDLEDVSVSAREADRPAPGAGADGGAAPDGEAGA